MFKFTRLAIAVAGSSALVLGMAGAAGASVAGNHGEHHHGHHFLRVQHLDGEINLITDFIDNRSFNDAGVRGPGVLSLSAEDTVLSAALDRISDSSGNGFEFSHQNSLGTGVVDRQVCQVRFINDDQTWSGFGGQGTYLGFRTVPRPGNLYDLTSVFSFGFDRRGNCSFGRLSDGQIISLITGGSLLSGGIIHGVEAGTLDEGIQNFCHRHHIPQPTLENSALNVQFEGWAVVRQHQPRPYPTSTETIKPTYAATPAESAV